MHRFKCIKLVFLCAGHGVVLKFLMTGLLNGMACPITVIRMCPPLTTKNWNLYEPLLAVGMCIIINDRKNTCNMSALTMCLPAILCGRETCCCVMDRQMDKGLTDRQTTDKLSLCVS